METSETSSRELRGQWPKVMHLHSMCVSDRNQWHEGCERVSRMSESVGGVFSYPRPRRKRGVDSPGVSA